MLVEAAGLEPALYMPAHAALPTELRLRITGQLLTLPGPVSPGCRRSAPGCPGSMKPRRSLPAARGLSPARDPMATPELPAGLPGWNGARALTAWPVERRHSSCGPGGAAHALAALSSAARCPRGPDVAAEEGLEPSCRISAPGRRPYRTAPDRAVPVARLINAPAPAPLLAPRSEPPPSVAAHSARHVGALTERPPSSVWAVVDRPLL